MAQPNNTDGTGADGSTNGHEDTLPSKDTLSKAIQERTGAIERQAKKEAEQLLRIFGDEPRIEDEDLDKDTRAFLYRMHSNGVIGTDTVEAKNEQGRDWLYFHWVLDAERIERISEPARSQGPAAYSKDRHPAAPPLGVA